MAKLALAVIAKDEEKDIVRIIESYRDYFDELAFAIDDQSVIDRLSKIYNDSKVKLYKYEWIDDFAHKRNFLASKIQSEWYLRMDTDDAIIGVELLRKAFEGYVKNGYNEIFFEYLYCFDKSGNCTAKHWRETVIKNDGNLVWNKAIHENLKPISPKKVNPAKETQIQIKHLATQAQLDDSTARNLRLLIKEYQNSKEKPDPRTVGYIARMLSGLGKHAESILFFERFLETSGWDDDKYFAWCQLCNAYVAMADSSNPNDTNYDIALGCATDAMVLKPEYPDAYFCMLTVFTLQKKYDKAIEFGKLGFEKKTPDTMYIVNPSAYTYKPLTMLATAYMGVGKLDEALTLAEKAYAIAPKDTFVEETRSFIRGLKRDNDAVKYYAHLMGYLRGDLKRFKALTDSMPKNIAGDEMLQAIKHKVEPAVKWGDKSIVIYCGGAWEDWVDTSVIGGIGGSEEAVIYLSRELVKQGYEVTVFNQCGELGGVYNGVTYKSFYEFNPKDEFNILISWRQNIFSQGVKAKKRIVWLHDVPFKDQFTKDDCDSFDKIVVLSKFHRDLLTEVPDDKVFISTNGVNVKDFEGINEVRNPKRMIWASSYDRGLEPFLEIVWKEIQTKVPDAELHIFYGWNTYLKMMKEGKRDKSFYDKMLKLMKQRGVYEHGRIGHKKLAREFLKSGIWAYPTNFEEINCITALKAQIAGAIPVVNNYAALRETVRHGVRNEGDVNERETYKQYADLLVDTLKNPPTESDRAFIMEDSKRLWSWETVAKSWQTNLF